MNLTNFYINTFGTTELWGLNLGFYFTMLAILIIVVIENVVFWSMKVFATLRTSSSKAISPQAAVRDCAREIDRRYGLGPHN